MWYPYGHEVECNVIRAPRILTCSTASQGGAFRTRDFIWQERAMDALLYALERTMVGFT